MSDRLSKHWINGEYVASPVRRESVNPATGDVSGTYCDADTAVVQSAIDAAAAAFTDRRWRMDAMRRATALSHLADAYAARINDLIDIICLENGKLRHHAGYEVGHISRALRFCAGLAVHNFGRVVDPEPGRQSLSIRHPIGVAGLIVPWNSPAYLMIRAVAPALAAGCTTVVKFPAQSAQIAAVVSDIIAGVPELPKGAVNIFIESGSDGARLLVDSPQVAAIHFTGSTATGRLIAEAAGKHLKRVGLELGGKTPHLVFDDADLDEAVPTLVRSSTTFAGQFCMTGSRILVQRGIADDLKARLTQKLTDVRPGPAADSRSEMGPMIDKASVARVDREVEEAISAGAKILVRGGPTQIPGLKTGAFYHPTLLEVADSSLPIAQREIFGPVQTLQIFDTEEEAIRLANDSEFGLSASIWTQNLKRPLRVARELDAGVISVNSWANLAIELEENGFKASGVGRLGGVAALELFIEYKQISQYY